MNLPFFFAPGMDQDILEPALDEDTMRHMVQVLRMKVGEQCNLTNGRGLTATAILTSVSKKACAVSVKHMETLSALQPQITIAISPLKNPSRFEWFLEKSAEIGINRIVPLLCNRTEKQHIKKERWRQILVSAMLQSQQAWLTELADALTFDQFMAAPHSPASFIAHCMEGVKEPLGQVELGEGPVMVLIGPEGDFTPDEVKLALGKGYRAVSLGATRLRTETAGISAAVLLRLARV
jgi:16S rRNA (uracil1498-N3)-methyltransferase